MIRRIVVMGLFLASTSAYAGGFTGMASMGGPAITSAGMRSAHAVNVKKVGLKAGMMKALQKYSWFSGGQEGDITF